MLELSENIWADCKEYQDKNIQVIEGKLISYFINEKIIIFERSYKYSELDVLFSWLILL